MGKELGKVFVRKTCATFALSTPRERLRNRQITVMTLLMRFVIATLMLELSQAAIAKVDNKDAALGGFPGATTICNAGTRYSISMQWSERVRSR
jgi:hypothetical protein